MTIDWNKLVRNVVDLGSESYEQRLTRTIIKAGCVVLFLIVAWKVLR